MINPPFVEPYRNLLVPHTIEDPNINGLIEMMLKYNILFPQTYSGFTTLLEIYTEDRTKNASDNEKLEHICHYLGHTPIPQLEEGELSPEGSSSLSSESCDTVAGTIDSSEEEQATPISTPSFEGTPEATPPPSVVADAVDVTITLIPSDTEVSKPVATVQDEEEEYDDEFDEPVTIDEEEIEFFESSSATPPHVSVVAAAAVTTPPMQPFTAHVSTEISKDEEEKDEDDDPFDEPFTVDDEEIAFLEKTIQHSFMD